MAKSAAVSGTPATAEMSKATQAKIVKILEVAKEKHDQMGDLIDELDELLGGGVGIGAKLKRLYDAFSAAWADRYARGDARAYVWNFKVDGPNAKRMVKAMGVDEVVARIPRFMRDDYEALVRARHPFGWFTRQINSYAAPSTEPAADLELEAQAAIDCRHTPPCKTDAEHTRRRSSDLRAVEDQPRKAATR
jgi:hypothetical protein